MLEPTDSPPMQWCTVNPSPQPGHPRNSESRVLLEAIRVTVEAGETLYLPNCWYKSFIPQEDGGGIDEGKDNAVCLGVHWWYDREVTDREVWSRYGVRLSRFSNEDPEDWYLLGPILLLIKKNPGYLGPAALFLSIAGGCFCSHSHASS